MPKQIKKWKCDHCKKSYVAKSAAVKHESICFYNPCRTPRDGEMAIWDTMPRRFQQDNSYGVPESDWSEPRDMPFDSEWWPLDDDGELGLGYFRKNSKWEKIKGYTPPKFAPGFSWVDEMIDGERVITHWFYE